MHSIHNIYALNSFIHDSTMFISINNHIVPITVHMYMNHTLLFGMGDLDDYFYELEGYVEIMCYRSDGQYITMSGEVVFDDQYIDIIMKRCPTLLRYYRHTPHIFKMFYLKDMCIYHYNGHQFYKLKG